MYDFIFFVLYRANLKDGEDSARYNGIIIVSLALLIHIIFVLAIIKEIFIKQYQSTGITYWFNHNRVVYIILLILFAFIVYRYYNSNKIKRVMNKYVNEDSPTKPSYIVKILLILILPIIGTAIILSIR